MALQDIIDTAVNVEVNRSKLVAQTVSRSGKISTASRSWVNPFRFIVTPKPVWTAAEYRAVFEPLFTNDKFQAHGMLLNNINFNTGRTTLGNSWMVPYQGYADAGDGYLEGYITNASTGTKIVLEYTGDTITSPTTKYIFKAGDYIRPWVADEIIYSYIATNDVQVPVERNTISGTITASGVVRFSNPRQPGTAAGAEYTTRYTTTATRTTITGISSTTGLTVGQIISKASGTGVFGGVTYIANIDSATQISIISTTDCTSGAIVFNATGYDSAAATDNWTVAIPVHRGLVVNVAGSQGVLIGGAAANFNVIVTKLPQIRYLPGKLVELTSDLELIEEIR
jgi:hypothetical protein